MYRTFNMGTGFLVFCLKDEARNVLRALPDGKKVGEVVDERRAIVKSDSKKIEVEAW